MFKSIRFAAAIAAALTLSTMFAMAASPTVTMAIPPGFLYTTIAGASGTAYTPSASGQITVSNTGDVRAFLSAGFTTVVSGTTPARLRLLEARNANGSAIVASGASAGNFAIGLTAGTSEALSGEAATGATKTDTAVFEYIIPSTYVAGTNLTIAVNANYSGAGTAGTATVAAAAYLAADAGTQGSNLVATAAQAVTVTATGYNFTVSGATLTAGMRLIIKLTDVMQETGGSSALTGAVNSVTVG